MLIEILQAREYRPFGARVPGEQVEVDDGLGKQLIEQGFAREVKSLVQRGTIKRAGNIELKEV